MKKVRVLSLDGGGIRGIIPARVIQYVEEKLAELTNKPEARIADFFDLIVGTSTGGILSCFYLVPNPEPSDEGPSSKYPASRALEFYTQEGYNIFNGSKRRFTGLFGSLFNATKYSPAKLEQIFKHEFADVKMNELLKPCVVTSYDLASRSAIFFNSREPEGKQRDYYVRDVARSTSAAPTYFPPAKIKNLLKPQKLVNIDGGVFANNPAMCAYAECRKGTYGQIKFPSAKDMLILSIGTGGGKFELPNENESGGWGVVNWAKTIPNIMMDGSIDTVHVQMKNLFEAMDRAFVKNYKRVDVPTNKRHYSNDMANASADNIKDLLTAADAALEAAQSPGDDELSLDDFINLLID